MGTTFKDVTKVFTVEQALDYYCKLGIAVVVNDGKDITFEIEKPPGLQAIEGHK